MLNNKLKFFLPIVILLVLLVFVLGNKFSQKKIYIKEKEFKVEIADSIAKRSRGLGGKEFLCQDCGMLFIFPKKDQYGFWMKDMKFPLDIIWLSNDEIVHMEKNILPDDQRILKPSIEADKVLEINAGKSDELQLDIGDKVSY